MKFSTINLKRTPEPVKFFISWMVLRGWTEEERGGTFVVSFAGEPLEAAKEHAAKIFPAGARSWDGPRLTISGETAKDFMGLYRRAVGGHPHVEQPFLKFVERYVEKEAVRQSKLMRFPLKMARREVRESTLITIHVLTEHLMRER